MRFGLKENAINQINAVFAQFPEVKKAILYGSRAKGNFRRGSDIDLVLSGEGLTLFVLNKIRIELDELLLPYTFDISNLQQIDNAELIQHVERVGVVFYERGKHNA